MKRIWILAFMLLILPAAIAQEWIIDGNTVYINDSKAFISAAPHTLPEPGEVEVNALSKVWSGGTTIGILLDMDTTRPGYVDAYYPRNVTEQKSATCNTSIDGRFWTASGGVATCYQNYTILDNSTNISSVSNYTVWQHAFDSYDLPSETVYWDETHYEERLRVSSHFSSMNIDYDGFDKLFYVENVPMTAGENLKFWFYLDMAFNTQGKYGIMFFPSSYGHNIQQAIADGNFYYLDPWYGGANYSNRMNLTNLTYADVPLSINGTSGLWGNHMYIRPSDCNNGDISIYYNDYTDVIPICNDTTRMPYFYTYDESFYDKSSLMKDVEVFFTFDNNGSTSQIYRDYSLNQNNMTWNTSGVEPQWKSAGCVFGGCMNFSRVMKRLYTINNIGITGDDNRTYLGWVNIHDYSNAQNFVGSGGTASYTKIGLYADSGDGEFRFGHQGGNVGSGMTFGINSWSTFSLEFHGDLRDDFRFGLDGSYVQATGTNNLALAVGKLVLGGDRGDVGLGNDALADNIIDNVWLFNSSLTDTEITTIYNNSQNLNLLLDIEESAPAGGNSAPNSTTPSMQATIYNTTDANCSTTVTDENNDNSTVMFKFFNDSGLIYSVNNTNVPNGTLSSAILNSSYFSKGHNITCSVRAYDGTDYEAAWENVTRTINNSIPTVPALISPNSTTENSPITFNWSASTDADNDPIYYYLSVNGTLNYSGTATDFIRTLAKGFYSWTVLATDNESNSSFASSLTFNVDNTPGVPSLSVVPATAYTDTPINVTANSTEPDGDNVTYYATFSNLTGGNVTLSSGSLASGTAYTFSLGSDNFSKGDVVMIEVIAGDGVTNSTANSTTKMISDSVPVINLLEWTDNNGLVNQTSFFLNRVLDYIETNATDIDVDLDHVTLRVFDPDGTADVNANMTNASDIYSYLTDISLDKLGSWRINITACDTDAACTSTESTVTVSNTPGAVTTGAIYGYEFNSRISPYGSIIINETAFATADNNSYKTIAIADYANDWFTQAEWDSFILNQSYANTYNIKTSIVIDLSNENLSYGSSDYDQAMAFIPGNFTDLLAEGVVGTIQYIELYLGSGQTGTNINSTINDIAGAIIEAVNNEYNVFVSVEHEAGVAFSGLDTTVARNITDHIRYLNFTSKLGADGLYYKLLSQGGIATNNYMAYSGSQVSAAMHTAFSSWHEIFIDNQRGTYTGAVNNATGNQYYWTFSNGDRLIYNYFNGTDKNITFSCTAGKSIFDRVDKDVLEGNTTGTTCYYVLQADGGDQARLLGFETIESPLIMTGMNSTVLYGTTDSFSNQKFSFHNDSIWNDAGPTSWQIKGANDAKIRLLEYGFVRPMLNIFYGQFGSVYISDYLAFDLSDRSLQILAGTNYTGRDGNVSALVAVNAAQNYSTDICMYDSLADYNNSDAWETAHKNTIDEFYSLNSSLCVYEDGWDYGEGGANFTYRTTNVINHAKSKGMTVACNTYTTYQDVTPLCDIITTESVVCRWDGSAPDYNYSQNDWSVDVEKAQWFQSYDAEVYGVFFVPRDNYTYAYDCWAGCKVLGYDDCYADQPDFDGSYPQDQQRYPDIGALLQADFYQDGSEYCREYEKGTVCYDPTAHEGRIIWNRNVSIEAVCMRIYDNDDLDSGDVAFRVNDGNTTYYIDQDGEANFVWQTACNTSSSLLTEEANEYGVYEIQIWHSDRGGGQGFNLANAYTRGTGVNSWWDTTGDPNVFNAYAEGQQWLVSANFTADTETILDESPAITQSVSSGTHDNIITISSANHYDLPVQLYPVSISNLKTLTYNGTSLTWNSTGYSNTVNGEVHIVQYNGSVLVITTPHLSNQTYNGTTNQAPDTETPTITPSDLAENDNATCQALYTDPDDDNGTVMTKWYVNGVLAYSVNDTNVANGTSGQSILSAGNYSVGDNVTCSMKSYDGYDYESAWENATKTVLNAFSASARISPATVYSFDDITGHCNSSGSASSVSFCRKLYKDGVLNSSSCGDIEKDMEVSYSCTGLGDCSNAVDEDLSTAAQSYDLFTVSETTEVEAGKTINWTYKFYTIQQTGYLHYWNYTASAWEMLRNFTGETGTKTYSDIIPTDGISGNEVKTRITLKGLRGSFSIYAKYFDGKAVYANNYSAGTEAAISELPAWKTSAGENWTFSCLGNDGAQNSSWSNATITILANPFDLAAISPTSPYTDDNLSMNATFANSTNQSAVVLNFEWSNGSNQASRFITSGLIAYYPFDNNYLDFAGAYDGTAVNVTLNSTYGKFGPGIKTGGNVSDYIASYVQAGNGTDFSTVCDNGCSFVSWVNLKEATQNGAIISRLQAGDYNGSCGTVQCIQEEVANGTAEFTEGHYNFMLDYNQFELFDGNGQSATYDPQSCSVSTLSPEGYANWDTDIWYQVAGMYNLTHTTIYINGVLMNATDCGNLTINQTEWLEAQETLIGAYEVNLNPARTGVSQAWLSMNASIDETMIFNRTLTAAEISRLYEGSRHSTSNAAYSALDSGLTSKDDTWTVNVTMYNATSIVASTQAQRTVLDTLPVTESAVLSPSILMAGGTTNGYCRFSDLDTDTAQLYSYWTHNGEIIGDATYGFELQGEFYPDTNILMDTWTNSTSVGDTLSFTCLAVEENEPRPNANGFAYAKYSTRRQTVTITVKNPSEGGGTTGGDSGGEVPADEEEDSEEVIDELEETEPKEIPRSEIDLTLEVKKEESAGGMQTGQLTAEKFIQTGWFMAAAAGVVIVLLAGFAYLIVVVSRKGKQL